MQKNRKNMPKGNNKDKTKEPKIRQRTCDLFGVHAVGEAILNPKRHIHEILVTTQGEKQIMPILRESEALNLQRPEPIIVEKHNLEDMLPDGAVHQGMALRVQGLYAPSLDKFCSELEKNNNIKDNIFVVLDQVTDTHNVGAILRSSAFFSVKGMIVQERHTPEIKGVIAKVACGGVEHVPVFRETNLSRALEVLQNNDILCMGLDERGRMTLPEVMEDKNLSSYSGIALVLGAEGEGLRRLTAENCDVLVQLPSSGGAIKSLNVSNAAAVALYELNR